MFHCFTLTPEWLSAIISGLALLVTGIGLISTRNDSKRIQLQVDSLVKLTKIYERSRRDEINPFFIVEAIYLSYTDGRPGAITVRNNGQLANELKVIQLEIDNVKIKLSSHFVNNLSPNSTTGLRFDLNQLKPRTDGKSHPYKLEIEFKNIDKEVCRQIIERSAGGASISHLPFVISE